MRNFARRAALILITGLCFFPVSAQQQTAGEPSVSMPRETPAGAPDYGRISDLVASYASPFYYPALLRRYQAADTTLTTEEFRMLYYGYPSQPGYQPLASRSRFADSLTMAFSPYESPTPEIYRRMVGFANELLKENPFSMRDLNVLAFVYQAIGEPEQARAQMFKVHGILKAIQSTGTGLGVKSPWFVIYQADAEDVLALMGARFSKPVAMSASVEFYPVSNMGEKGQRGLYFDISRIYNGRNRRAAFE